MRTTFAVLIALLGTYVHGEQAAVNITDPAVNNATTSLAQSQSPSTSAASEPIEVTEDLRDGFVMIKGRNGKVLSFHHKYNEYGNKVTR